MAQSARVHVLVPPEVAGRFEAYCKSKGFKKSTLIVRLIREHLDRERFETQTELFEGPSRRESNP